jgi:hypothetical protein
MAQLALARLEESLIDLRSKKREALIGVFLDGLGSDVDIKGLRHAFTACLAPADQVAAEHATVVSMLNDFLPNVLDTDGPSPPWAAMMLRRLPPNAAPFEARETGEMIRVLNILRCPHTGIFKLLAAAGKEESFDDMDEGYEESEPAETDSDDESLVINVALERDLLAEQHAKEDREADDWLRDM